MRTPSFYALAGRLLESGPTLDLSSVRVALCGGEPIDPEAIERFLAAAARHGLDRDAFLPAYGLAEATLAVTMPTTRGLRIDEADAGILAGEHIAVPATDRARARGLVRLGPAVPGLEVCVADPPTGRALSERSVGEVRVRGTSVTAGCLDRGDEESGGVRLTADGWLATGDLG
ncbi:AMP-binding protein [Frankia tisae]|uniref:AMP-binding protein n=1 Tax=Frankia tisae TaxID=2950104 RepID=UPI0021C23FD0|nr:AMP-binding protein [Frankia tisae]